jgi:DHA2 family multidrug resistance protein
MPAIKGFQLVLLTIAVSAGIFMNVLDTSIANVAIPTIAGNLGVSSDQGTWVITSFTVCTAIVLPLTGWLAKRFGEVRLFIISTLLFTLTSFLCGFASSFPMLVFFRALQGAVAGPMIPLSQSLLLESFPPDKKGFATSLWAMVAVAGPVLGPILGGYITDNYHWPWIFYINIPVGLFAAYFTWKILGKRDTAISKLPIDFVGLILLAIGVGSLQILLDRGQDLDWFNSNVIITLAISSIIAFSFFLVWELTAKYPIVDLSLFKSRNFTVGTIALSLGFMVYFGCVVVMPLWLQTQQNYTPTWAGFAIAPLGILPMLLSPVVGKLVDKIDLRVFVSFGFFVFAFTCFWQAHFNTDINFGHLAWVRFIQGLGAPCFFIPTTAILLTGLPDNRLASAAGLSTFLRILGGSFGTSISVALWDRRESLHQSRLVETLTTYNPAMIDSLRQLNGLGFMNLQRYGEIYQTVINQSYMLSTNDIFWGSGVIFLGLLALVWLAKPPFLSKAVKIAE